VYVKEVSFNAEKDIHLMEGVRCFHHFIVTFNVITEDPATSTQKNLLSMEAVGEKAREMAIYLHSAILQIRF